MKNIKFLTIAILLSFGSFVYGENEKSSIKNTQQLSIDIDDQYRETDSMKRTREQMAAHPENDFDPKGLKQNYSFIYYSNQAHDFVESKPMVVPILFLSIGAVSLYQYYRVVQARQKLEQAKLEQAEKQAAQEEKQEHSDGLQA